MFLFIYNCSVSLISSLCNSRLFARVEQARAWRRVSMLFAPIFAIIWVLNLVPGTTQDMKTINKVFHFETQNHKRTICNQSYLQGLTLNNNSSIVISFNHFVKYWYFFFRGLFVFQGSNMILTCNYFPPCSIDPQQVRSTHL